MPTERGTTQIDHLVISRYGLFAIETKNYRGDIYGDDNRKEWSQIIVTRVRYRRKWWKVYKYVTKNTLYNPVKQSAGHAIAIRKLLSDEFPNLPVFPIVVFSDEANLNGVSSNRMVVNFSGLTSSIQSHKHVYLSHTDVMRISDMITSLNVRKVVKDSVHIKNLRMARQISEEKQRQGICPQCGADLKVRNGRYGSFMGCSNYPQCKFTSKIR